MGYMHNILSLFPTAVCMDLILNKPVSILGISMVIAAFVLLFILAQKSLASMWKKEEGATL